MAHRPHITSYDRYLASRLLITMLKVIVSLVLLFVLFDFLSRQEGLLKRNAPFSVIALYYLCLVPSILFTFQVAALSVLISALMVFGRAAQDSEITALLAGGVGIWRISRAPIVVAFVIAILCFFVEDIVGGRAAVTAKRIDREFFSDSIEIDKVPKSWSRLVARGVNPELETGWSCHIDAFDSNALRGEGVLMHFFQGDTLQEIRADGLYWNAEDERWNLTEGTWATYISDPDAGMTQRIDPFEDVPAPFYVTPKRLLALEQGPETKSSTELRRDLREAKRFGINVGRYRVDYYAKFARPALSFVMIWLAIPFAIRLRRGGFGVGFGMSIAIGVSYLLLFYLGMGMGHWEMMNPAWAAWIPNLVFFGIGFILFFRTPT